MQSIHVQIDVARDNDSVMDAAMRLLESDGKHGWDDLLDSMNGAYDADKKLAKRSERRMFNEMGRGLLREALDNNESDAQWSVVRGLVLRGLMQRAAYFDALK